MPERRKKETTNRAMEIEEAVKNFGPSRTSRRRQLGRPVVAAHRGHDGGSPTERAGGRSRVKARRCRAVEDLRLRRGGIFQGRDKVVDEDEECWWAPLLFPYANYNLIC
jgi:hypothetical protein